MFEEMLAAQPVDYSVMYVDMNSFFASVEQQENPEWRGKPLVVVPYLHSNASIVAASNEAKANYGIRVGMKLPQATARCPGLIAVSDHPSVYRDYHQRIMAILDGFYCKIGVRSIDEAYMIIPSYARTKNAVYALSQAIKAAFDRELGEYTKCSVGVGPNIWLAKMAAGQHKPDGLTVVLLSDLMEFYGTLKLIEFTGVGRRMARQLYARGIMNASTFYAQSLPALRSSFGVVGTKWYLRMRGYEVDLDTPMPPKSLSHQVTVIGNKQLGPVAAARYIRRLADRVSARLRSYGLGAGQVSLFVRYEDGAIWHARSSLGGQFGDTATITNYSLGLLDQSGWHGRKVRLFAIAVTQLAAMHQLDLGLLAPRTSDVVLSRTIDEIRYKYGPSAIGSARELGTDLVPDRIGFGHLGRISKKP